MRRALLGLVVVGLLACVAIPEAAVAAGISFTAIDLPDAVPGEDLWQYSYSLSGFVPAQNTAFETLFDPALYGSLQDPPPFVNTDWDIVTLQPDPLLPDVGRYSALALLAGASVADPFPVSFRWLGGPGTSPGAQPFEISEFDDQGNFLRTVETGETIPVPEPGIFFLVSAALGLWAARAW